VAELTSAVEREVKLAVGADFQLPDLTGAADGIVAVAGGEASFETVYYDTPDLRLARSGISVRCRVGETADNRWTVKLPEGDAGSAIARREVVLDAPSGIIPDGVRGLVRAHVRASSLGVVAVMRTVRRKAKLRSADGTDVAEIDDDEVSVIEGGRVARSFRELEVELESGADASVLPGVVERLRAAGATDALASSKLAQALGAGSLGPPEVVVPPGDPAAAAVASGVARVLHHDPAVRLGNDEDLGHLRAAVSGLRSLVEGELGDELRWLDEQLDVAPSETLDSPRYLDVLEQLVQLARGGAAGPDEDGDA